MKRLLMINSVCGQGSTGRICVQIAKEYEQNGYEVKIAYGRYDRPIAGSEKYAVHIGNKINVYTHLISTRLLDRHGLVSKHTTRTFLRWADEYDPDILWIHNIHGYYINFEMLFEWIKERQKKQLKSGKTIMKVNWTLHDCWAFTGHCSHFTYVGCTKWKTGCKECPQKKEYPTSFLVDNSKDNYDRKNKAFCGVNNLTIITPSHWLENLVRESFLGEYLVEVKYNTVDTSIFKPSSSGFRQEHGIKDDQVMILGVSSVWNERKGLGDILNLAKLLDLEKYRIVIVGMSAKQVKTIPHQIIGIEHTDSLKELAEIYSSADVFVNLSREETFGLTTLEALACGTRAIVYKGTACEEVVRNAEMLLHIASISVAQKHAIFESKITEDCFSAIDLIKKDC